MDLMQAILTALFCMAVVFGVLIALYFLVTLCSRAIRSIEKIFTNTAA